MIVKQNYLENLPLEKAKETYYNCLRSVGFGEKTEFVPVRDACGRRLKNAVYAKICSPHYNASAMDGVAVKAKTTFGASENSPLRLAAKDYSAVDTGDPIPEGTDAVIMVEDLIEAGNDCFDIISSVRPWQNVRQVGEDICMGDMIAPSNTILTPALCGALLAGGITEVEVCSKPTVGVIPTGDEIVPPTSNPEPGDIIEFNSSVFSGMLEEWGAIATVYPITPDKKESIRSEVKKALKECDIVLVSAGSSAGRDDYTSEIIASLGSVVVHGIAVKPGKPAVLGIAEGKPVVGLPGYPVSAIVIMDEIVRELCFAFGGETPPEHPFVEAVLGKRVVSSLKYREYVRVSLGSLDGRVIASPLPRGAGVIGSFTKADGMLIIEQDSEGVEAGETVKIRLLRPLEDIENTLIVTGSHDPLIDEVIDILSKGDAPFRVCSTHVGSMGAIRAVQAGNAHLGGIHLLDTETGEYNKSYIEKYFPEGGAVIVGCVGRVQGLMIKAGNPLKITAFTDISRVRYVNRQRGAGTRILCDYLLEKHGISPDNVDGYYNEEFTHTAVAALVAAGNADAGLGILSAAKIYGLDFIPICTEKYEFLVDEKYINDPKVKMFLDVLRSDELKARLQSMGGYSLS